MRGEGGRRGWRSRGGSGAGAWRRRGGATTALGAILAGGLLALQVGCGGAQRPGEGEVLRGRASYYSDRLAGNTTASGDVYRPRRLTAAHRTLPFGTMVRVTNLRNGRSVEVRINDRGPFGDRRRIIDLSRRAAEQLDMIRAGVVPVEVEIVRLPERGR